MGAFPSPLHFLASLLPTVDQTIDRHFSQGASKVQALPPAFPDSWSNNPGCFQCIDKDCPISPEGLHL